MINKMNVLAIFSVMILFSFTNIEAQESRSFKLGAVLATTGPMSIQGVPMRNAMLLAKEQLDKNNRIQILFEDDGFVPKNTVSAVNKLLTSERVDAVAVFGTQQGLAVADMIERAKIPFISINVNRKVVLGRTNAVLFLPAIEDFMKSTITEVSKRGYKTVAAVASIQDSALLQLDLLVKSGAAKIVYSQELPADDQDMRMTALQVKNSAPQALFVSTLPPQGSLFTRRVREVGYKGEIFTVLQTGNRNEFLAAKGGLDGAWFVAGDDRQASAYYAAYQQRFSDTPTAESIYTYDLIKMILQGLETQDLNNYLHSVRDFTGMAGTYSSDGRNSFSFPLGVRRFTESGFEYLD